MFQRGSKINGAVLLEPTQVELDGRVYPAWVCRLDQDEIKIIKERDLRRRKGTRTGPLQASMNRIFFGYKDRCRKRNIYFELSMEDFKRLTQQACVYCNKPPSNGGRKEIFVYNGIDRKNNSRGYTVANSVPACAECNQIKSDILSFEEMLAAMKAILEIRGKKRKPPPPSVD